MRKRLLSLAEMLTDQPERGKPELADWLKETDGEFFVVIHDKQNSVVFLLNDIFARLPIYYHLDNSCLIVSRDLRYIREILGKTEFSSTAILEYTLFGYMLGERTFFNNIQQMPPACLIQVNFPDQMVRKQTIHEFNYENKLHAHKSIGKNIRALVDLFTQACKNRVSPSSTAVVSLSGGFDSRAIAAALHHDNIPFSAATYLDEPGKAKLDVTMARQVAEILRVKWRLYELDPLQPEQLLLLLKTKSGLVPSGKAYTIQFFREILRDFGPNVMLFNGLGGDKTLPALIPDKHLHSLRELAHFIIRKMQMFPIPLITKLTGWTESEIVEHLARHLASFPEAGMEQKFVHFIIQERTRKRFFEGDDRKRYFFWSGTPFFSPKFFSYAMNCPDQQKKHRYLYSRFMNQLCPHINNINYARAGLNNPVSYTWHRYRCWSTLSTPRFLMNKLARLAKGPDKPKIFRHNSLIIQYLQKQSECPALADHLNRDALQELTRNFQHYPPEALAFLFNLTAVIEEASCGKNTCVKIIRP